MRSTLAPALSPAAREALGRVTPAVARGIAEAAWSQIGVYHEASLDYGRSAGAESGLYYLGSARGQREFVEFACTLGEAATGRRPPLRPIAGEIDSLEHELLLAYRPPASIDRHRDFILASSAIKEARELEAQGLLHGALVRYLLAAMRTGVLLRGVDARDPAPIASRLREYAERFDARVVDHSIGRFLVETAAADLANPDSSHTTAAVIVDDVLPRYLEALRPARAAASRPAPAVTVTLVRWPYT